VTPERLRLSRILIVDDEPADVLLMQRLLEDDGYETITTTTDPRHVLDLCRETCWRAAASTRSCPTPRCR
jgi:CheY-like chemotaxis protein